MLEYEKDDDGNKIVENGRFKINEDSATNIKDYNNNQTYIPNLKGYAPITSKSIKDVFNEIRF